jgi:HK97 family phage portal protein
MLRSLAELRQHGSTTWKVSESPPGKIILGYGWETYAGKDVSPETALSVSAVYACIRGIAETTSTLPKILYKRIPNGGKRRAWEHPLYPILHDALNKEMTAQVGWELGAAHACAWGNAYYQIIRNKAGDVAELWPLRPDRMSVERTGGVKKFHYQQVDSTTRDFPAEQIMHIPAFGFDGLVGYSPIQMARNALALTMAAEEFGSKFFANDARPGMAIKHPKTLSDKSYDRLIQEFNDEFQGSGNSHKTKVLEEGMEIQEIGIPPEDAQFLQTRDFQVAEVARFYRYPLSLLESHGAAATYASVEQFMLSFVIHTIRPWLVRFEQAINKNLLTVEERSQYFCETLVDSLLRGDIASRYAAYATGRQWGWLSADDILALENRNPLPGGQGQVYLTPMNMVPASVQRNFAPVVAEAAERIVRREIHDLREGIKKGLKELNTKEHEGKKERGAWLKEFYAEHAGFIEKALRPAAESYARMNGRTGVPELETLAEGYVQANRAALEEVGTENALALLEKWERELPELLARGFFDLFPQISGTGGIEDGGDKLVQPQGPARREKRAEPNVVNVTMPEINIQPAEVRMPDINVQPAQVTMQPPDININNQIPPAQVIQTPAPNVSMEVNPTPIQMTNDIHVEAPQDENSEMRTEAVEELRKLVKRTKRAR